MIDKVAFSGRETMLTKSLEKAAANTAQEMVVRSSSILPPLPVKPVETIVPKSVYTSPYALVDIQDASKTPVINKSGLDIFA